MEDIQYTTLLAVNLAQFQNPIQQSEGAHNIYPTYLSPLPTTHDDPRLVC